MSRTVFCQNLKKEAEGLSFQLYPGELGKRIFDNICSRSLDRVAEKTNHVN